MKKFLLLLPALVLVAIAVGGQRPGMIRTSSTSSDTSGIELPVLRHRGFGDPAQPAQPATPKPPSAIPTPAQPAQPAQPSTGAVGTPIPVDPDDPCDGFNNTDARERCREDQEQRNERQFERDHNTPGPFFTPSD